jgi:acetoin utilization protein AcuC
VRVGKRHDLVVDEAVFLRGIDHVDVAKRRRAALPRDHPDSTIRADSGAQLAQPIEPLWLIGCQEDEIRVRQGFAVGHVGRPLGQEIADPAALVDRPDERDPHPRPDPELVEQRRRVGPFHGRIVPRYRQPMADMPLLVFGPRSLTYDFGPIHPLTPRRFGPGIDLLRAVGAEPDLAPEPASDAELRTCHAARYLAVVKRFSEFEEDWTETEAGIGSGDDPPFRGMHEAAASVAGGSLRAIEAILRGEIDHAFHPGGGLHHAMPSRASGFCIYNDPALAIARARADGLRVLYVDLDVHHGDGVQEIHRSDPGVLTVSLHESGRYLFPGTGFVGEIGEGEAAGTVVNVPLEPETGERAWLSAVQRLVPELAAAFAPDIVVSQHGCDTHAWDPLAHLNVTTTAMGTAARLVDAVAHRHAGGRWLATGGGGYGVYRVVPRAWSHVWLAGAHREAPDRIPAEWLNRWAGEAIRYGDRSLPLTLDDEPNAGLAVTGSQEAAEAQSLAVAEVARRLHAPLLIREAVDRGWWSPTGLPAETSLPAGAASGRPTIIAAVDRTTLERLSFADRLVAALSPDDLRGLLMAATPLDVTVAVDGSMIVGLVASVLDDAVSGATERAILAVGVAPVARRGGLATRLLDAHLDEFARPETPTTASISLAERDPIEPLDRGVRASIARRLLDHAGFSIQPAPDPIRRADPEALEAIRR